MAVRWVAVASLPVVFLVGAAATIEPVLSIAGIAMCILAVLVRAQFRSLHPVHSTSGLQPDWIVVILPTALAIRSFSATAPVLITGLLVAAAFMRKTDRRFQVQPGPFILLVAASAVVFSRPANTGPLLTFLPLITFLLVGTLVARLVMTVDARKIIVGLIDGCGVYLLANVLLHAAGLQSPASNVRFGGLVESTGFVRTIYPLAWALNTPPTIAAIYASAIIFLILEAGWLRRSVRLICLIAAIIILVGAGSRAPMVVAAFLSISVISFPHISRWLGQGATILAAISAFILPVFIAWAESGIAPLISLVPGRAVEAGTIDSIGGRDYIWKNAIDYWIELVNGLPHMLFGFGANGQYRSGASLTYSKGLAKIIRNPENASVHNSFLQQLFDGGLVGWLLLVLAIYWGSAKLAKRQRDWGNRGLSAIVAMAVLLLSGMTEVSLPPGAEQDTFWLLMILVGVACQANGSSRHTDRGHEATATQEMETTRSAGVQESRHGLQSTHDDFFTPDRRATPHTSSAKSASN
jgi:O-antigen ligase